MEREMKGCMSENLMFLQWGELCNGSVTLKHSGNLKLTIQNPESFESRISNGPTLEWLGP